MHSDCFRKYGAHRNGCAHLCGIGYALTITVTCEHTEKLTLVEVIQKMSMVQRRVCYRLAPGNLKAKYFRACLEFQHKTPVYIEQKNEITLPSNDSVIDHAGL